MITQFENGFITKSKLNEMVDGINTNTSGLESFVSLTGSILFMATPIVPNGWLKADGLAVSRATYSRLFTAIGTTYGSGDGSTTFNLPDLRGQFIRGFDDGRGVDSGRVLGSYQADQNKAHTHTGSTSTTGAHTHTIDARSGTGDSSYGTRMGTFDHGDFSTSSSGNHAHTVTIDSSGETEVRVKNIALMGIIKY